MGPAPGDIGDALWVRAMRALSQGDTPEVVRLALAALRLVLPPRAEARFRLLAAHASVLSLAHVDGHSHQAPLVQFARDHIRRALLLLDAGRVCADAARLRVLALELAVALDGRAGGPRLALEGARLSAAEGENSLAQHFGLALLAFPECASDPAASAARAFVQLGPTGLQDGGGIIGRLQHLSAAVEQGISIADTRIAIVGLCDELEAHPRDVPLGYGHAHVSAADAQAYALHLLRLLSLKTGRADDWAAAASCASLPFPDASALPSERANLLTAAESGATAAEPLGDDAPLAAFSALRAAVHAFRDGAPTHAVKAALLAALRHGSAGAGAECRLAACALLAALYARTDFAMARRTAGECAALAGHPGMAHWSAVVSLVESLVSSLPSV